MLSPETEGETPANKRAGADPHPTLRNHWWHSVALHSL